MTRTEKLHKDAVLEISNRMQDCYRKKKKVRIYHGTTNSTRTQNFKKQDVISVQALRHILTINRKEKYVVVEPNVPMDMLVRETLKYGLIPPVVMEFPGITVGGGIQGGAGESSSFRFGLFHHTALEYEMVLGNGTVIDVSPNNNTDLYWGSACSYGTMGIMTKIKLRLIPAKQFVHITYYPSTDFADTIQLIQKKIREPVDFIDSILFSKHQGIVMTAVFSDKKDLPVTGFSRSYDNWFYLHAKRWIKKNTFHEELIPLTDYLFRYNRGAFWVGKYAFKKLHLPFNRLSRFFLNPLMKTKVLYRFLQAINISQRQIVQDLCLPQEKTLEFLHFIDSKVHIYPVWLLPGSVKNTPDKLSPGYLQTNLVFDIGVWGRAKGSMKHALQLNRQIEHMLQKCQGRKVLYAHQYYTKREFWHIYDEEWYKNVREKYFATDVFPDIYEKTHVSETYNVSLWKGLLNVMKSPFSLPLSS